MIGRRISFGLLVALAATAHAAGRYAGHPVLGTWEFSVPDTRCTEVYFFKDDGTQTFVSGQEVGASRYEISAEPRRDGAYVFTEEITRSNGKPDCLGQTTTPKGEKHSMLLRFTRDGQQMFLCFSAGLDRCIGPFRRIPDRPA